MPGQKGLMIIGRVLSPPYENKHEVIYHGEEFPIKEMPARLGLDEKTARGYYYSVFRLNKKQGKYHQEKRIEIEHEIFTYPKILTGINESYHPRVTLTLPFEASVKKSLVDFLSVP